jgi:hypothetical protein
VLTDASGTDRLDLLAGVTERPGLARISNNLELSVIGTTDRLTINGWYTRAGQPDREASRLADGRKALPRPLTRNCSNWSVRWRRSRHLRQQTNCRRITRPR